MQESATATPLQPEDPDEGTSFNPDQPISLDDMNAMYASGQALQPLEDRTDLMTDKTLERKRLTMQQELDQLRFEEDPNTKSLFDALPPTSGMSIDKQEFMISNVVRSPHRAMAVGYVTLPTGQVAPRLFYKSLSQGEWRVAPYTARTINDEGIVSGRFYSKGETMQYGYARETQIHDDLSESLEAKLSQAQEWGNEGANWLMDHFTNDKLGKTNTYRDEAFEVRLYPATPEVYGAAPGHLGLKSQDGRPTRDIFAHAALPERKMPNYSSGAKKTVESEHPILGTVITETYLSGDTLLAWKISRDSKGRVWVAGVSGAYEAQPTSYGTNEEVVSAGVYDNKPLEYKTQVRGLEAGVDYKDIPNIKSYVDISPLLDHLPVIRAYRLSQGVQRLE